MIGQLAAVMLIVAGAALYLAWQTWRSLAGRKGCASGCGCTKATKAEEAPQTAVLISPEQITLRRGDAGLR
jgi:hypothetical protein